MTTLLERLSRLPDAIFAIAGALALSAIYLLTSAALEIAQLASRLPLAPSPSLALLFAVVNGLLTAAVLKAIRWTRPLVAAIPLAAQVLEHGFDAPRFPSLHAADFTAGLLLTGIVIYCFYFRDSGRRWFERA